MEKNTNKNKILIIATTVIIALIVIMLIAVSLSKTKKSGTTNSPKNVTEPATVVVVETSGSQDKVVKKNIQAPRKVDFGKTHKAVQKTEKDSKDIGKGNYIASPDGTTAYLTYSFSADNAPEFFGTKVNTSTNNALLQYVFDSKDKLYEIRLQYGKLTKDAYDSIVSNISSTYGDATYLRTLSNGSIEKWWNTKTVRLTAYYQESGVNVYIRKK